MRPAPLPPARHARLFELIRQGNLAELCRETRLRAPPEPLDADEILSRAMRSIAA